MYILRCTQALLSKLGAPSPSLAEEDVVSSSTKLGDWYANRLNVGSLRLVICTSEASLLSVVVPAKDPRRLPEQLADALRVLLSHLGVPAEVVAGELAQMTDVRIGRTRNRRVLGSMNDLGWLAEVHLRSHPGSSLQEISLDLADVPCSPLKYEYPAAVALRLLNATDPAAE